MQELTVMEIKQVNGGGVVFLIPPAVTIGAKILGIGFGIVAGSLATFSAYYALK